MPKQRDIYYYVLTGGAAGAVSRITGTLGKGIAALTMDDEYQESRRTTMSKKPTSVKEGLSRGGKGLLEVGIERPTYVSICFKLRNIP